jgi:4-hydroxy-tetrahydrodipicolinate reductase
MIRLALLGATGRMGRRTLALLPEDNRFELSAALTRLDDPQLGQEIQPGAKSVTLTASTQTPFDVLLDFSIPAGTMQWLEHCEQSGSAMVIGATGYTDAQSARIEKAAARIPILKASNFGIGINLLLRMIGRMAQSLGDGYDIEIIEHHHKNKVDAPSGTAIALAEAIVESTGRDRKRDVVFGRAGNTGERPPRQIGIHAIRMGALVSRHEVYFGGPEETITLTHTAHSRDVFVRGALQAAAWIHGKPTGMYRMTDVISR